jgi:hypothetical protein
VARGNITFAIPQNLDVIRRLEIGGYRREVVVSYVIGLSTVSKGMEGPIMIWHQVKLWRTFPSD